MSGSNNLIILSIEGNIGSGKSTVLRTLKESCPDWTFVDEPVSEWLSLRNEHGESLLELFYKDKKRWSYTFQNVAVLHRFKKLRHALDTIDRTKPQVIIMERSLLTDKMIFAKMLNRDGFIDGLEQQIYNEWFTHLDAMVPPVDAYVYIHTGPQLCLERISKRARDGESIIPLEYLEELDQYHRSWLFEGDTLCPVLDFDNSSSRLQVNQIVRFIEQLLEAKNVLAH